MFSAINKARQILFTPSEPANWSPAPTEVQSALDQLAAAKGTERLRIVGISSTSLVIRPLKARTPTVSYSINPQALVGGFVASTRYHVYAYNNAGSVAFECSITAPDAGYFFKSTDSSRTWITTFVADGGSRLVPYTQLGLDFVYDQPDTGTDATQLLLNGAATTPSAVALNYSVPNGASAVTLFAELLISGAGRMAHVRSAAGGNDFIRVIDSGIGLMGGIGAGASGTVPLNAGASFVYYNSDPGMQTSVTCLGFKL